MNTSAPKVALVGPTASGKSELSLQLAQKLAAQVVNADSMQLYRGMDIGTAKLPIVDRRGVQHHLLDIWPVTKTASLAEYQSAALTTIGDLNSRRVAAVLVGGSGMYVQSVVDQWDIPGTEPAVRARLADELRKFGPETLHDRLAQLDPQAAAAILPSNGRRIVRALEVVELRGSFAASLPEVETNPEWVVLGLEVPRDELDDRIEKRVAAMWSAGFVDEVEGLVAAGLKDGTTANRALGYAQVLAMLEGSISEEQARDQTIAGTRRFARRQMSWFRRDHRIHWLPASSGTLLTDALAVIARPPA